MKSEKASSISRRNTVTSATWLRENSTAQHTSTIVSLAIRENRPDTWQNTRRNFPRIKKWSIKALLKRSPEALLQGSFLAGSPLTIYFFAYNYGVQRRTGFGTFPRGIRPLWARDGFFFIVCIHVAIALLVIIPTNKTCDFHKLNLFVCISKNIYTINR